MAPLDYRWAHAVNSRALLARVTQQVRQAKALQFATSDFCSAVEADVIWSERQQRAVMGHPPAQDGDVPFEDFLRAMLALADELQEAPEALHFAEATSSGSSSSAWSAPLIVKCDFKSMQAFVASRELMTRFIRAFPFPRGVFVNADILKGPVDPSDSLAFDAREFLEVASALARVDDGKHRDKVVLSVGWTSRNATDEETRRPYSPEMVDEMLRVLEPFADLAVTFPLRATSVRESWAAVRRLLLARSNYSFTLWWALSQMPDEELEWLYHTLELELSAAADVDGKKSLAERTFYDILGFERFLKRREYLKSLPKTELQN